jgi:hypothetical protein
VGRASNRHVHGAASGGRRRGRPREWTDERIHEALVRITGGGAHFPTQAELRAAGHSGLANAITEYGGARHWAEALGVPLRPAQLHPRYDEPYTDELAIADAHRIIQAHGLLPGANKLRQLDEHRLADAVLRAGGAASFRRRHGI